MFFFILPIQSEKTELLKLFLKVLDNTETVFINYYNQSFLNGTKCVFFMFINWNIAVKLFPSLQ